MTKTPSRGPDVMPSWAVRGPPAPVMVESPYNGPDQAAIDDNIAYALHCMHDALARGEAPMLTHLLYTRTTADGTHVTDAANAQVTRAFGLDAALAWRQRASKTVLYTDRGVSSGMARAADEAGLLDQPVERRSLPHWAARKQGPLDAAGSPRHIARLLAVGVMACAIMVCVTARAV